MLSKTTKRPQPSLFAKGTLGQGLSGCDTGLGVGIIRLSFCNCGVIVIFVYDGWVNGKSLEGKENTEGAMVTTKPIRKSIEYRVISLVSFLKYVRRPS